MWVGVDVNGCGVHGWCGWVWLEGAGGVGVVGVGVDVNGCGCEWVWCGRVVGGVDGCSWRVQVVWLVWLGWWGGWCGWCG